MFSLLYSRLPLWDYVVVVCALNLDPTSCLLVLFHNSAFSDLMRSKEELDIVVSDGLLECDSLYSDVIPGRV